MSQYHTNPSDLPPDPSQPRVQPQPGAAAVRRELPRFKVVLLQDHLNDMMFIVRTVMDITRLCQAEATHKMWEAHHLGRSILLTTYRERAEFYLEQLATRGLRVTLEAA